MRDPKRLLENDPDSLSSVLLQSGRADVPGAKRSRRIVAGLVGAGATLTSAKAGAAALTLWRVGQWCALGAIGGVAATSALFVIERSEQPVVAPAAGHGAAVSAPLVGSAPRPRETAPTVSATTEVSPEVPSQAFAPHGAGTRRTKTATAAAPDTHQNMLAAEAVTLAAVKSALDRKSLLEARAALRAYRTRFPGGTLSQDASYLEMEVEVASGNGAKARELAATLATGTTPSARRARAVLRGVQP